MEGILSKSAGLNDMRQLEQLNEESILANLQTRHAAEIPYTYSGNMCLAVNPYKWLPVYGDEIASAYLAASSPEDLPPHVYAIASNAFHAMVRTEKDQSILVSGESGAGKTETTKIVLKFLASSAAEQEGSGHGDVVDRVLQSNPVLEAFGNAQTVRNNNSSRFGKLIQLQFAGRHVVGANSITLLLEKSRVVFQSELERNFHVFYQLLSSDDVQLRDLMLVKSIHAYHYLRHSFKNSCFTFEDSEDWKATLHALQVLGVTSDEIQYVKEVLAAILHLGNITFAKVEARDSKCVIITDGSPDNASDHEEKKGDESEDEIMNRAVSFASQLLACSEEDLRKSLLTRRLLVGGEWIDVPLTLEQAQDNRDALSKELYSRTFDWLVTKINQSTSASCPVTTTTSVLDIFGFEHFQFNSFEQLCINYANEHLQQRFTKDVFECAQAEYVAEGVPWDMIAYKDNKELLDLFEGRLGVLSLLNEECMLPKGNDVNFVSKLLTNHSASAYLQKPSHKGRKGASGGVGGFVISHYAGNVEYSGEGMMKKNQDTLQQDLLELISSSASPFLQQLVGTFTAASRSHARRASVVADTVSVRFKTQLQELMKRVSATATHYIRCIKPNEAKSAIRFDRESVTEQLRCSGVLEAVRISRAGFPDRMASKDVVEKYGVIGRWQTRRNPATRAATMTSDGLLHALSEKLRAVSTSPHAWFVGKTKIFFAAGILAALDRMKANTIGEAAAELTRTFQALTKRRQFLRLRKAVVVTQAKWRQVSASGKYRRGRLACVKLQAYHRGRQARKLLDVLLRFKSAVRIQAAVKRWHQRRVFKHVRTACITIQSVLRMLACRNAFRVALAEAREQQLLKNQLETALKTVATQATQLQEALALIDALKLQLDRTSAFRPHMDIQSLEVFSEMNAGIAPTRSVVPANDNLFDGLEDEDVNPSLPDSRLPSMFEFSAVKPRGGATPSSNTVVPFGELQNRSPKRTVKTPKHDECGLASVTSPIKTCEEGVTFGKKPTVSKKLTTLMGRSKTKTAKKLASNAPHVDLSPSHWPLDENSLPLAEMASPDRVMKREVSMSMEQWVSGDDFSQLGSPGLSRIKEPTSTPSRSDRSSVIHDLVTTTTRKVTTFVKETVMPLMNTMQMPALPGSFTGAKPTQGKKDKNESPAINSKFGSPSAVKVGIKVPAGRRQVNNSFGSALACSVPYEEISYFGDESTFSFKGSIM